MNVTKEELTEGIEELQASLSRVTGWLREATEERDAARADNALLKRRIKGLKEGATATLLEKRIIELRDAKDIQGREGNWNLSPYMHGIYNGLISALAVMQGEQPVYSDPPEDWLDPKAR